MYTGWSIYSDRDTGCSTCTILLEQEVATVAAHMLRNPINLSKSN